MERGNFALIHPDEDRYRLLVDAIIDYAIYMLDIEGKVTSWNPGAQRFKGYTPTEIIGQHFSRFYSAAEQAAGTPARALRTASEEGRFEQEGWRIRKDGSEFWAHVIIDPIRTPSGELVGFAKITRDLTERRAAEEALRQSEQQFRLLVQGVTDYAIYMLDPTGRVSNWNSGAQRIKGYAPAEIIGEHFSRFYTPEDQAAGVPALALATAVEVGRFEKEGWRQRKDGSRFWAHVVIDAIRDETGELMGFAKITRDITERREAQQALDQAREALFQSQKMEAIGQLTGGVAHDFNNLLMAILGSLELVRKRVPYDPRITPLLDNAVQGAERGSILTQRMLAFARKQELKVEAVDVATLARGMMTFLDRTIGGQVQVSLRFPTDLPRVLSDPYQLEAALMNLAVNARDAMPRGGDLVISACPERIEDGPSLAPGDYVRLSVTDTGEGMSPETLQRATDPFFTTKGVGKGTGLGLSMVHGLAAQSGGGLFLTSEKGVGTQVDLFLPVVGQGHGPAAEPDSVVVAGPAARKLTILAVDDDSLVLTNTAAMLDDLGHEVIAVSSAKEALETLRRRKDIDLIVSDEVMPHMSGSQLAQAVQRTRPGLPFVIATGYADLSPLAADEDSRIGLRRLSKPFTQSLLAQVVDEAMNGASAIGVSSL